MNALLLSAHQLFLPGSIISTFCSSAVFSAHFIHTLKRGKGGWECTYCTFMCRHLDRLKQNSIRWNTDEQKKWACLWEQEWDWPVFMKIWFVCIQPVACVLSLQAATSVFFFYFLPWILPLRQTGLTIWLAIAYSKICSQYKTKNTMPLSACFSKESIFIDECIYKDATSK